MDMKYPSRNRKKTNVTHIVCPYCKHRYKIDEETEDDYIIVGNTKVYYCRKCGWEFIPEITKDIDYKYS